MADASLKLSVDGASSFKKDLKSITDQSKLLAAQTKAVTTGFSEATPKEEKYQKTAEALNKQIQNQKKYMDTLAKAIDASLSPTGEATDETTKLRTQYAKAQTALNKMEGELNDAEKEFKEETKEVKNADKQHSTFKDTLKALVVNDLVKGGLEKLKNGFRALGDAIKNAAKWAAQTFKESAKWADDLQTLSKQTGISTDKLQEYQYMSGLVDVEVETVAKSMARLTKNMGTAQRGTGDAALAFEALGISITDNNGQLRNNEEVFNDVITALGAMGNETQRDAYAMQIFGRSAQDLNPLILAGGDALAGYAQDARDMGYVLDTEAITKLNNAQDAFDKLSGAADAAKRQLAVAFAPLVNDIADNVLPALTDVVSGFGDVVSGATPLSDFLDNLGDKVVGVFEFFAQKIEAVLPEVDKIVSSITQKVNDLLPKLLPIVLGLIKAIIQTILNNLPEIVRTGMELIMGLISGIGEQSKELIPAIVECILIIIRTIVDNIPKLIDSGGDLVIGIIEGILDALPKILENAPEIIVSIITAIVEGIPKIIAQGGEIVLAICKGIIKLIPALVMLIPRLVKSIIDGFKNGRFKESGQNVIANFTQGIRNKALEVHSAALQVVQRIRDGLQTAINKVKDIGRQIIDGIKSGFMSKVQSLRTAVMNAVRKLLNSVKSFLGIHSPSKVFADEVGKMIPEGIAVGIEANTKDMIGAARNSMDMLVGGAAGGYATNYGGVTINVYGAEGQDVNALADIVMQKMQFAVNRREAVYA